MRRDHGEPVEVERCLPLTKRVVRHRTPGRRRCQRASAVPDVASQEAVDLQVVAGARNHLQANRSLEFCFEIQI